LSNRFPQSAQEKVLWSGASRPPDLLPRRAEVAFGSYSLSLLFELSTLISPLIKADWRVDELLLRDEIGIEAGL
jgi:hypothetical protein